MIDFQSLVLTLGLLLLIVSLTTVAAIVNKIHSNREDDARRRFLDDFRKRLLLLGDPEHRPAALSGIAQAMSGRWAQLAAEEVSQLDVTARLDVVRAVEASGLLARYLRESKSPLKWTRAHALRVLGELKAPASVPALLEALEDRDSDVRNVAARSLGRMKVQAAEEALVALLGKHEQSVSARVAAICIEMGARTAPLLIRTMREGAPRARFWSARILGEIRESRAIRSLGDALVDPEPDVRSAAAWALGRMADRSTSPLLQPALRDPVWYVRAHAAEALGRIGDASAAPALGDALRDRSWWVRRNALDALVSLREAARPVLARSLESDDRFARDCAAEGMAALGPPEAPADEARDSAAGA